MGELPRRTIRSYVLRQGRLTSAQNQALKKHWETYGINYKHELLDLDQIFRRSAPKILDVGTGTGEVTISLARNHPENDYLAVDVYKPGIGRLIREITTSNIRNIRIICHDIVEILHQQIPDNSLDEVHIFFPDPWPKKRHHKRRLINSEFISLLVTKLKFHARIFIATDWWHMAEQILNICDNESGLINLAGTGHFAPRPRWRNLSKFEQRGKKLDHSVWDMIYSNNNY